MRLLRCGDDGLLKTLAEVSDCLLLTRQHSTFDQDCQTRIRIDASQGLAGESTRLNDLSDMCPSMSGHGAQAGIGGFHPAKLDLFKQFDERIGLGEGGNRALQNLVA